MLVGAITEPKGAWTAAAVPASGFDDSFLLGLVEHEGAGASSGRHLYRGRT
jgi:hypothetical protein